MASSRLYGHVMGSPVEMEGPENRTYWTVKVEVDTMGVDVFGHLQPKKQIVDVVIDGPVERGVLADNLKVGSSIGLNMPG